MISMLSCICEFWTNQSIKVVFDSRHIYWKQTCLQSFFLSDFYSCWYTKNKSKVRKMDQTCYTHPVSGCFGCGVCPLRLYYDTLATSSYNIDLRAVTIVRPQLRYLICLLVTVKCFCNRFFVTDSSPHTLIDAWSPQPLGCTHGGPATGRHHGYYCVYILGLV